MEPFDLCEWKRGDIHPTTGRLFWGRHKGRERWVSPTAFKKRRIILLNANRKWVGNNRDQYLKIHREFKEANRQRLNREARERFKSNPLYKLKRVSLNRISRALKRFNTKAGEQWYRHIGCSPKFLKSYLETRFLSGMIWDNHGSIWHIDHVIPLASAKSATEIRRLCHYSNLQPMFKKDNMKKSNKMPIQTVLFDT
jgi:hypothetical protein